MVLLATADQWRRTFQISYDRLLQRLLRSVLTDTLARPRWAGFVALVLGMGVVTLVIAAIHLVAPTTNLSLFYLLVVIWLALVYGRGIAILAAFVAFLAYDVLFIPPVFRVTVDDPAEYVALGALLVTGIVVGQLTAELRRQVQIARESQHHTSLLYALSQDIADDHHSPDHLLATLSQRVLSMFTSSGVQSCALYVPDAHEELHPRAVAQADRIASLLFPTLDAPVALALAEDARSTGTILSSPSDPITTLQASFVPLTSHQRAMGVLGLVGTNVASHLLTKRAATRAMPDPQAGLFTTVCDQIALALERAQLHQEAIQAQALRESERLKEAFLESITHDLRTPIAAIQASAASLLQTDVHWDAAETNEFLTVIVTSAKRLGRLVDNLLALSHLEAGMAHLQKVWYPINDIIATSIRSLERAGQMHHHAVEVTGADDLLEAPMDPVQMERVITNLIENALKYSPPGSTVRIAVQAKDHEMEVRVSDQGIGIPPDQREAIFDKFYRLHRPLPWAAVQPPQGTGLGLAICASIVHAHGGRIWVESTPGEGATFIFTLPLDDSPVSASHEERPDVVA
jgi:two-component system, OmpR family, sensor histidine kinase KdpD